MAKPEVFKQKMKLIKQADDERKFYEAVRQGVHDAVWRMITNATDMPCTDFFDAIQEGVATGIKSAALAKEGE